MGLLAIEGSGMAGAGRKAGLDGSYRSPLRSPISMAKSSLFLPSAMVLSQKLMGAEGEFEDLGVAQAVQKEMAAEMPMPDRVLQ